MSVESKKQRRLRRESERRAEASLKNRLARVRADVTRTFQASEAHQGVTDERLEEMVQHHLNYVIVPDPKDMLRRFKAKGRWE